MAREQAPTNDLLSLLPGVAMDDVAIRRLRQRVLDDVAGNVSAPARPVLTRKRLGLSVAAVAILAAGVVVAWPARRARDQARPFVADVLANVFTDSGLQARWSRRISDGTEWVALSEGRFHIRVGQHDQRRRVAVEVPDGRIDDVGTTFDVVVGGKRTTRVVVEEGSVVLRLTGEPAIVLNAGQVWEPRPADAAPTNEGPRPSELSTPPSKNARSGSAAKRHAPDAAGGSHATDRQAEDDAYLRVIHLLRAERRAEAREAARDYLRHFPDGFRREEMGSVIQ